MDTKIKNLIAVFALAMMFTVVFAANENANPQVTSMQTEKNMTYGQCVSAGAVIKNTCYGATKETYKTCAADAKNQTESRTAAKVCSTDYKKNMNDCKVSFKSAKKECAKIKHNFLETLGSAFK